MRRLIIALLLLLAQLQFEFLFIESKIGIKGKIGII